MDRGPTSWSSLTSPLGGGSEWTEGLRVGPLTSPLGGRREWTEGRRTFVLGTLSKRGRGWLKKEKLIGLIIITIVLTII